MVMENFTPGLYVFPNKEPFCSAFPYKESKKCNLLTSRMFQLAEGNDKISFYLPKTSFLGVSDPIRRNRIKIFCLAVFVFTWKDWG
jgi:hypothetical protein